MSLTRSELQELHDDRCRQVALRRRPGGRDAVAEWLTEPGVVPRRWPPAMAVAWVVVFITAAALEPSAADPEAPAPLWASLLFMGLLVALTATSVGLSRRQRGGLVASAAAAGLGLVAAVMCPVSAHHAQVGAWWYLQMAGFVALVGASLVGLRRARA
ncbi:MAG: hypothetical protein M3Q48_07210 [Actinomycetota bacterium]|nr:hypothetical protein [Actinomycetota bacterium]